MDSNTRRILVMDANQRSGLAVTRSLGQAIPDAVIHTADDRPSALAGHSKYSQRYLQHPNPSTEPSAFIRWAKQTLCGQYELILPTTEVTSQLLLEFQDELQLPLAFSPLKTVMKLADKGELVRTAQAASVPVPDSEHYGSLSELDVQSLSFPVILKPCQSKIFTGTGWIATTVRLLRSAEDLAACMQTDDYLADYPFMIQEFIPGHGAGIFCLYNKGQPTQFFAHQRLREKPPEGGVSVLSQAMPLDEKIKTYAEKLLSNVGWHGVAMVEFRIGLDGTPYLMEVNTRFWGSLQLSIDAGVDFPAMLAKQHFNEAITPVKRYNTRQQLRWLLGDLDSLYIFLKRPNSLMSKFKRIGQFLLPRFSDRKHEVNRWSDLGPFWEELRQYIGK